MVTNYNLSDEKKLVETLKQENERICDCFYNLSNVADRIESLLELAINIDSRDREQERFSMLLFSIQDYAYEMKILTDCYCQVSDTSKHIC